MLCVGPNAKHLLRKCIFECAGIQIALPSAHAQVHTYAGGITAASVIRKRRDDHACLLQDVTMIHVHVYDMMRSKILKLSCDRGHIYAELSQSMSHGI